MNRIVELARVYHDPYDEWAWCLGWLGSLCDVYVLERGRYIPSEVYTPGCLAEPDDSYEYEEITSLNPSDDELEYAIKILDRYANWLKMAGKDY